MLPTLNDEIGWDAFLEGICAGCKTVAKNNGFCPYEGQEGDCKKVAKKLVENRKAYVGAVLGFMSKFSHRYSQHSRGSWRMRAPE